MAELIDHVGSAVKNRKTGVGWVNKEVMKELGLNKRYLGCKERRVDFKKVVPSYKLFMRT